MRMLVLSNMVESNGKTVRENNTAIPHNIPVGTLVEVHFDEWHGDGACEKTHARLWVIEQGRDCDGSPMYWLCDKTIDVIETIVRETCTEIRHEQPPIRVPFSESSDGPDGGTRRFWNFARSMGIELRGGFGEDSLTPVEVTEELKKGVGALDWAE